MTTNLRARGLLRTNARAEGAGRLGLLGVRRPARSHEGVYDLDQRRPLTERAVVVCRRARRVAARSRHLLSKAMHLLHALNSKAHGGHHCLATRHTERFGETGT